MGRGFSCKSKIFKEKHELTPQLFCSIILQRIVCVFLDEQKLTGWTPWSNINQTANGHWIQRYRFACTASVPDPNLIKTSHVKTHTRFCTNENNTCYKPGEISNEIDTKSPLDHAIRKFCKHRRKLFNKFCNCRTLGIFLICTKCSKYG